MDSTKLALVKVGFFLPRWLVHVCTEQVLLQRTTGIAQQKQQCRCEGSFLMHMFVIDLLQGYFYAAKDAGEETDKQTDLGERAELNGCDFFRLKELGPNAEFIKTVL